MTRPGQTHGFSAKDHIATLEKYIGKNCIDIVLINSEPISKKILERYSTGKKSFPVVDNLKKEYFKIVRANVAGNREVKKVAADGLQRSLIRHNPDTLAKILISLL